MLTFSNSLIYIHSVFHIFNTSKLSSVVVPVGSAAAAAGDKSFGSRASWPLLPFNLVWGIQLVTLHISEVHSWNSLMPTADQIGVFGCVLQSVSNWRRRKKIQFALYCLCYRLPQSTGWYEDIMWNCLHDYPIKRLIHNLKQLKGGDCYSVFLTRFSQAVDCWGLPSLTSLLVWMFTCRTDIKKKKYIKHLKICRVWSVDFVIEVSFSVNSAFSLHSSADSPLLSCQALKPYSVQVFSIQHCPYPSTTFHNPGVCSIDVMLEKVLSQAFVIYTSVTCCLHWHSKDAVQRNTELQPSFCLIHDFLCIKVVD